MKSSRKWLVSASIVATAAVVLRAELPVWVGDIAAGSALEAALFRVMGLPGGSVMHVRPAWESRSQLDALIQKSPHEAELYSIRAREEERLQYYDAAETDFRKCAAESHDKLTALTELANFYRDRLQLEKEVDTLLQLGAVSEQPHERFEPDERQAQWPAFTRALKSSNEALLPPARRQDIYEAWIRRYPKDIQPYQAYLDWAVEQRNRTAASAIAQRLKAAFPKDVQLAVTTDANLARVENGVNGALAVYSKNFSPLWPESLRARYAEALSEAHQMRAFLANAQSAAAANPTDLDPALRLFFYYEQENRNDVADQQLLALESRRAAANAAWRPAEVKVIAPLFQRVQDYDESARAYYMLYELRDPAADDKELALASLISLLLDVPEQPLHFGNRDLSLYKNIAQMDPHPGFLNGILSLALNTTSPEYQYRETSQIAVSYFHRASASRLLELLRQRFPNSSRAPELEAKLFNAYGVYGQYDAIIGVVPRWLASNRNSSEYVNTALLLADAYEARKNTPNELALYDRLLTELAASSDHVPIGDTASTAVRPRPPITVATRASRFRPAPGENLQGANARSPDYARVLDRYISRLVQLDRKMDAVALFRREIDHNPDDPGIYERLALFLEQNDLDSDLTQTYRQALSHFKDMSWASKLARFYLRRRQYTAYRDLARQVTDTFKGSELARFITTVSPGTSTLARDVNVYAHRRFPHNLVFVQNLLRIYRNRPTQDFAAYEKLLRENWFYDSGLRTSFFQYLSWRGTLASELAGLPDTASAAKDSNVAALEFRAEGDAW
ncbi:MAG: hypothetical protein JOZ62_15510, partial [Acidobacteriaceae bacterium]|nr:hypothetical protein [Acidobacteriaceae bacterium]